ncbi:four helix bundle protein [Sphingobacterium tabacisoli]|uniref:Four helix bundle protein n=1 Tax=Sphingobacterium tabacisoli TaxID=2044855 RepID=A0ABW5KV66_9SPHI|nr:four helix bundle protein [Sphingobacterium tabacisoli]
MHQYKELKLWQKAIELVSEIYNLTDCFPERERFGLISQINRAAVSIPSNIAEGAGRNSDKEFVQFLAIAHASTYEVETQLIISKNLGYLLDDNLEAMLGKIAELQKMNYAFQQKLKSKY